MTNILINLRCVRYILKLTPIVILNYKHLSFHIFSHTPEGINLIDKLERSKQLPTRPPPGGALYARTETYFLKGVIKESERQSSVHCRISLTV